MILVVAFLDSVIPIVPSETAVIIGGVAAGAGDQNLLLVILAGALGAFLGDNTAYLIGRRFAPWFERRAETNEKARQAPDVGPRPDREARRAAADHGPLHPRRPHGADADVAGSPSSAGAGSRRGSPSPR